MAVALGGLAGSLVLTKPGLGRRLIAGEVSGGEARRVCTPATKRAVVWLGMMLVLIRIQRIHQLAPERTRTTTAKGSAVAGVQATTVWAVRGTGGAMDGRVRLAGVRRV